MTIILDDPLDNLFNGDGAGEPRKPAQPPASYKAPDHSEPCPKCRGSGRTRWGVCFRCKGARKVTYSTSPEQRAAKRQHYAVRRRRQPAEHEAVFQGQHPAVHAWMVDEAERFDFARSLLDAVRKYGYLTDKQMAAAERCIAKRQAGKTAATERHANAPTVTVSKLEQAFAKAGARLKAPRLHLGHETAGTFTISHAKPDSANPGALYVKQEGEYLGKIAGGRFLSIRTCGQEREAAVAEACNDPEGAVVKFGRITGRCGICNTKLRNAESVARGIGPICASKYGW